MKNFRQCLNKPKKKLFALFLYSIFQLFSANAAVADQFFLKDHLVIDLKTGLEWMRCSVGQRWNGKNCIGEPVPLNHDDMEIVIKIANEQLGDGWRLPSKDELLSLVCQSCGIPTINQEIFPNTGALPFWTGEPNPFAPNKYFKHFFTVNFYTGRPYGRFASYQDHLVRLARDR